MKQLNFFTLAFLLFIVNIANAQSILPYTFENNSEYADNEIYIGLVGKFGDNTDVWMNLTDSSLVTMSADDNTLDGPVWSTPATWKYPDIFTKLSDITDKTIMIPQGLYGCRIFISFESPMYLHFHETGGYAGANLNASTDPNDGIRWEIVELTWGNSGLWTNTSRVDAYQYPMALEVSGFTGGLSADTYVESYTNALAGNGTPKFGKIGELLPHSEILDVWDTNVSADYLVAKIVKTHSLDGEPIIEQPSKVDAFPRDVLDDYIDDIWATYATKELTINIGDRGTWTGKVTGERFDFVDPADGSIATIYSKPTSFNAIEGSGSLAYTPVAASDNIQKHDEDLMIQAQIAAAISRHAIYTDISSPTIQYTHDASRFFVNEPYNEYVSFFHNDQISYESQTYAFAYDDVGDHSSTIQCTYPTNVSVIIGGYNEYVEPSPELSLITISPNVTEIDNGSSQQFIAQGYDQHVADYTADITWSTTGGGSINNNGVFTATTLGDYKITARHGTISRSIDITVVETNTPEPVVTGCQGEPENGQYNYVVSEDTENPTITFIPTEDGLGEGICLLFYGTDPSKTFGANRAIPNVPFQINASEGETIYFYYTYSLPAGGENNTAGDQHSFVVGDCKENLKIEADSDFGDKFSLYPNPTEGNNIFLSGLDEQVIVSLYSIHGQLIDTYVAKNVETKEIPIEQLTKGLYLLSVRTADTTFKKVYKLIVN